MGDKKWFEGEQYPANIDITTVDNAAADDGNNDGNLEQRYEDYFNNFIY